MTEETILTEAAERREHWDTVRPFECEILTLTLWALHEKTEVKSRWCLRLGGTFKSRVPPLAGAAAGGYKPCGTA